MTCILHKPVVEPAISKIHQLRMIAEAFDDGGFTVIRIKELRLLLEAESIIEDLAIRLPAGERETYAKAEAYLAKLV